MTKTNLFSNKSSEGDAEAYHSARRKRSLPSWLLPLILLSAFAVVFGIAFADRLLPSLEVKVSPAILMSDLEKKDTASPDTRIPEEPESSADYSAAMLFQAAGWFEPDPLPIRATALVDGVIENVHILEGETVKKGQPLADLIAADTRLMVESAEKKLEQTIAEHHMHLANIPAIQAEADSVLDQIKAAEARLAEISDRHSRINSLSKGTVSEQEVTAARLALDAQSAKVASLRSDRTAVLARVDAINVQSKVFDAMIAIAEVKVAESKLALERTKIVSPVDGVVLELKASPGQKKLLRMDDPDSATIAVLFETGKLQARVDVPLADARQLAPGQPAIITSDFLPNAEFKGVVSRIVGTADLQRNTLQAKVRVIDPDPRLRPEMLCRVKFLDNATGERMPSGLSSGSSGSRAVMAPIDCIIDRDSIWVVSQDGARAEQRDIETGSLEIDGYIAVLKGLLAGEKLILPPHDGLEEGRRIRISETR